MTEGSLLVTLVGVGLAIGVFVIVFVGIHKTHRRAKKDYMKSPAFRALVEKILQRQVDRIYARSLGRLF